MLQYMRSVWRAEYWAATDLPTILYCGQLVRTVDFRSSGIEIPKRLRQP